MSSILELYQEILFTESMLKEILDGITGISEVDQGYINSNASEFKRLEQDKIKLFDSLGENARKMLDIGIVMDELVELGFSRFGLCEYALTDNNGTQKIGIDFVYLVISTSYFGSEQYHYSYKSPTWQQDLISKVKELINDK